MRSSIFILALVFSALTRVEAYSQDNEKVPARCLLGIFMELQQARTICEHQVTDLDIAIDAAIPKIEEHLIGQGELTRQQIEENKSTSMWGSPQDVELSAQMCTEAGVFRQHFTSEIIVESTNAILAAEAGQFSGACI
jgi:hypothetical protein